MANCSAPNLSGDPVRGGTPGKFPTNNYTTASNDVVIAASDAPCPNQPYTLWMLEIMAIMGRLSEAVKDRNDALCIQLSGELAVKSLQMVMQTYRGVDGFE
jgi:hypothetical protein